MSHETLYQRWLKLFDDCETAMIESSLHDVFQEIVQRYGEAHRHYHTLAHVNACLNHSDNVDAIEDRRALELALWFHDVIYDPFAKDNETQSAEFAKTKLQLIGETQQVIDKVEHLVVLTQHPSNPKSLDEKYLIDIDLSILGAPEELYDQYEQWVRLEYRKVPSFLYKKGRKKVLQGFLNQEHIYATDKFRDKYEEQARSNILRALCSPALF